MRIYLSNQNNATSQIKIYRDTKAIDAAQLPEPIAVLPGNAQYYDEEAYLFYDVDYYYRIEVIDADGQTIMTDNKVQRLGIDAGPGPKELTVGDTTFGVFGIFDAYDFEPELLTLMKKIPSFNYTNTKILKYIRNGIISYIPTRLQSVTGVYMHTGLWFESINSKPFFVNDTYKNYYRDNKQKPTIINNRKYDYHIPKLFDKDNTVTTPASYYHTTTPVGVSEVIDLYRMLTDLTVGMWSDEYTPFRYYTGGPGAAFSTCENIYTAYAATFLVNSSGITDISTTGFGIQSSANTSVIPVIEYHGAV